MNATTSSGLARLAADLSARDDVQLQAAGRTIRRLLDCLRDGEEIDAERLARIRSRAEAAAGEERGELREAARIVLRLVAEVSRPQRARVRRRRIVALTAAGGLTVAAVSLVVVRAIEAPPLHVRGPAGGTVFGNATVGAARFAVREEGVSWRLDGRDVTAQVKRAGGLSVASLPDGTHVLRVRSRQGFLWVHRVRTIRFAIDRVPPAIELTHVTAVALGPLDVSGSAADAVAVRVDGRTVELKDGRFSAHFARAPATVTVEARDAAGNSAIRIEQVAIEPRRPPALVRAVHVSAYGWSDPVLRRGVLALIAQRRINAVELDLKDESGVAGFAPDLPAVRAAGAAKPIYELGAVVRMLHAKGVRVIGRLVCFRDPLLASWAWTHGHRDWVVQTPDGQEYSGYGGFTNFANEQVRRYQIAIAVAAARAGVDDILYDYVRRPDGPISSMRFPGLRASPSDAIVRFLRESRAALLPYRTYLGASVFGVAATRPSEVAQPVRRMAAELDYVAPMVYPSHWRDGEYNVADPNAEPYEIVRRSLRDFMHDVRGTGARVVPWLQDFSLGVTYGPTQVRAQVDAAAADGIHEFLLWNPDVVYTAAALNPSTTR